MSLSNLILFSTVYAIAVATPGPGIATLVARVLAGGTAGIGGVVLGFVLGDLVWFFITIAGFALLMQSFDAVFLVVKFGGALYLAYLAWQMWTAPIETHVAADDVGRGWVKQCVWGVVVSLANPKVILFFLAILPSAVDLDHLSAFDILELAVLIAVVQAAILLAYIAVASRARRLVTSTRARRVVHRSAGTIMAGAALAIAAR